MNRVTLMVVVHSILPLFLGGILYILFRSTGLRMFGWLSLIGIDNSILMVRDYFGEFKNYLPNWIYYSLPDGLWVYSFTSTLLIYWKNDKQYVKLWLLVPFVSGILIEILQGVNLFPGTYDILDLTFSALGLLLSIIIINHKLNQNEKTEF